MLDDAMVVDKDDLNLYFPPDVAAAPPPPYNYPISGKNYATPANSSCQYDPNYYHYGYATSPINSSSSSTDATSQQQQQSNYQVQLQSSPCH